MSSGFNTIAAATRRVRGLMRPGLGFGMDESGNAYFDNSHDPTRFDAGGLYAEANKAISIIIGINSIGTIGALAATFLNRLTAVHLGGSQAVGAMTTTPNANAGTGATASTSGNDVAGVVTLTTGSGAWAAGSQLSVAWKTAYAAAPIVTLTPANNVSGPGMSTRGVYPSATTGGFSINFTTAATAAATWTFNYTVAGT